MQDSLMDMNPLVAIFMVTYNHERYIEEAIRSVLFQKTSFKFKLIIGDDCSTDLTTEICLRFQSEYPDQILVLTNQVNIGIFQNASRVFNECVKSGAKYIALLEGDDFWNGSLKLQRQVDILEGDESIAGSYHNTAYMYSDGVVKPMRKKLATSMSLEQVISKYAPFHTSSFIFRSKHFCRPNWFKKIDSVDLAMYVWHAQFGRLVGFDDILSTYRIHDTSLTSSKSHADNFDDRRVLLHRLMQGKIQHNHWDKYGFLIQSHLAQAKGTWKLSLPKPLLFFVDDSRSLSWEWRNFRMRLDAEILNINIDENADLCFQGKKVRLFQSFGFWNRWIWNRKIKNKMESFTPHIVFIELADYCKFKDFFGSMDVQLYLLFPMELEHLEREKKFYPNLRSLDWLSLSKDEQLQFLVNWNLEKSNPE